MKKILFFLIFLGIIPQFSTQSRLLNLTDLEGINQEIEQEIAALQIEAQEVDSGDYAKEILEFKIDTLRIERLFEKKLEINYSIIGMIDAGYEAEEEYDKLLDKYYIKIMDRLIPGDQETLKENQLNWLNFRESERDMNTTIATEDTYTKGGAEQRIIQMDKLIRITKDRVFELVDYLYRFYK